MLSERPEESSETLTRLLRLPVGLSADLPSGGGAAWWDGYPGHTHPTQKRSLRQPTAYQGTRRVQAGPVPLPLCWHWAWNKRKSKGRKREGGAGKGEGGQASSVLLLIHSSAFSRSEAVTSSAPGSPYMHKRKAIPFRRRPWVIDLTLNVKFGSAALWAPSHGKLMFPTNSVVWYSAFWKWSVGV